MLNRLHLCCTAMPSWSDLERYLQRNGWVLIRSTGRDKIYEKQESGQLIRRTAVSKGTGEIGKGLFARILKQQIGITKQEFDDNK